KLAELVEVDARGVDDRVLRGAVADRLDQLIELRHVVKVEARVRRQELEATTVDLPALRPRDRVGNLPPVYGGDDLEHVQHAQHRAGMHTLRSVVIESDHRLRWRTGQLLPRLADIAPQRLDVLENPCLVAHLLPDALVKLMAHLPEAVVAARSSDRHHRAEMPHDVIKVL